jgi:hypothetical protein
MKRFSLFAVASIVSLSGATIFTACSSGSDSIDRSNVVFDENGKEGVKPEFVISLPRNVVGGTRQENNIVQNLGISDQFRGIDNIRLIPFTAVPGTSSTKLADIIRLSSINALEKPGSVNYKVYADQFVPVGTKHFLFYGKAVDWSVDQALTSMNDKFKYGILKYNGLTEGEFTNAGSVNFSLEQINTSTEEQQNNAVGRAIIQLMSQLANVTVSGVEAPENAWSTTKHTVLAALYKNFIGTTVYSSNCFALILDKIYFGLDHVGNSDPARPLANRIRSLIQDACVPGYEPVANTPVQLKSDYTGYPANIGLPDGAARCRWNASGLQANMFVDMTANYTLGFKVKPTDYCYPAALWYYVSTPVRASNSIESVNYGDQTSWENVISNIYSSTNDEVVTGTRSVALVDPVQYAVGRLETRIQMESGGTIYDGEGKAVDFGDGYTLKGLLLGGQNSVNYAFESTGNENFCIYDRVMSSSNLTFKPGVPTTTPNHTLALETKTNQKVFAALELINNGQAFKGADGTIPAGGVFYMTVVLDPTTASNYSATTLNKIIMKDHVTKLTVNIKKGSTYADRNEDSVPDVYIIDPETGLPTGVDADGDGQPDPYDIDNDGTPDTFITDPTHGGPGWDTDGDGEVDIPVLPDPITGKYPDQPTVPDGLGNATNGVPDLSSPGIELGTSVNLEWEEGLILRPSI